MRSRLNHRMEPDPHDPLSPSHGMDSGLATPPDISVPIDLDPPIPALVPQQPDLPPPMFRHRCQCRGQGIGQFGPRCRRPVMGNMRFCVDCILTCTRWPLIPLRERIRNHLYCDCDCGACNGDYSTSDTGGSAESHQSISSDPEQDDMPPGWNRPEPRPRSRSPRRERAPTLVRRERPVEQPTLDVAASVCSSDKSPQTCTHLPLPTSPVSQLQSHPSPISPSRGSTSTNTNSLCPNNLQEKQNSLTSHIHNKTTNNTNDAFMLMSTDQGPRSTMKNTVDECFQSRN